MKKVDVVKRLMGYYTKDMEHSSKCFLNSVNMLKLSNMEHLLDKRMELRNLSEGFKLSARKFESTAAQAAKLGYDIWKTMNDVERATAWPKYKNTGVDYNDTPPQFRDWASLPDIQGHGVNARC